MKKLLFIFGTRPEFIKVYPVIQEAKRQGNPIVLVNTGQHKEMLNELLDEFSVEVDYDFKNHGKIFWFIRNCGRIN